MSNEADFEFAMPHLPQKYPLAYAPSHGPYEESTLSDLSTRMNTFLSEMDTQIVIPRPTHTGRAPSLDEADFDAAAVLSRAPSRARLSLSCVSMSELIDV